MNTIDFGYDQISPTFVGHVDALTVQGPGALLGEMSTTGIVPPGPPISGVALRNYSF